MVKVAKRVWQPTPRALQVLAAVCATGSRKDAAAALVDPEHPNGISYRSVEQHMRLLRAGSHAVSDAQLCWIYRDAIAPHVEPE